MSAHAKVIPMPEPTYRESITRQGNWTAVPMPILKHAIDAWFENHPDDRAPDWIAEAECIYWFDLGSIKPVGYYQKRWKWGRRQTYEFLKKRGLVRAAKETIGKRNGNETETEIPTSPQIPAAEETIENQLGTDREPVLPDSQKEGVKHVGETRATAPPQTPPPKPIDPWNPHHAPPDLDAVIGHGAKIGVSATDAEEFYHHYTAAGWRAGNGNAIAHWGSKLKSWSLDTKRKTGSGNGKRDAASTGKPQSSFERRMSGDVIERARESRARLFGLDKPDDGNGGLDPAKRLPG
jgi:hypothetical protein